MVENIAFLKGEEEKRVVTQVKDPKDLIQMIPWLKSLKRMSRASRAYMNSLFFSKPSCSDEEKETIGGSSKEGNGSDQFWQNRGFQVSKEGRKVVGKETASSDHRSSFSGVIHHKITENKRLSPSSSSSSSSSSSYSFSSDTSRLMPTLQRSNSMNSEGENSIQGTITYCKSPVNPRRKSESGLLQCSISTLIAGACKSIDKKPEICR